MEEDNLSKAKQILAAMNETLSFQSWNETAFIVMIGKKISMIRDDLATQIAKYEENELSSPEYLAHREHLKSGHKLVYVSLYSVDGLRIESWEKIIFNLPRQIVSRPVYANEEDVQNIIKSKEKKINEAYVAFFVDTADFLEISSDKTIVDKLGKPMIVLKDNAINLQNIDYFVHLSGKYKYLRGRLIKLE